MNQMNLSKRKTCVNRTVYVVQMSKIVTKLTSLLRTGKKRMIPSVFISENDSHVMINKS